MSGQANQESDQQFGRRLLGGDLLLWSPNIQAEAYLHLDKIFATRPIRRGTPKPLPRAEKELDITFESGGVTHTIDDLMRWEFVSGLLVVTNGEIVIERYARGLTPEGRWQSASIVKSLAAILVGAAVQDGAIRSIDQNVVDYVPQLTGSGYDGVTIRHLLQMSSGVAWTENTDDLTSDVAANYIRHIAARTPGAVIDYLKTLPRVNPPGTQFYYTSADPILLSHVIRRATGMTVADYCSEKLWKPFGFEQDGYFLLDSDDGYEVLGSCCNLCLRDYARLGLFMLSDGVIDGRRVIPEGWVAASTSPTAPNFSFDFEGRRGAPAAAGSVFDGYGYYWWARPGGDYQALGSWGQWVYVRPSKNTVAAILGAVPRHVYMTPEELALHRKSSHCGSEMRRDFIFAISDRAV